MGFGSGIYFQRFHAELRDFVASLPPAGRPPAFAFATSGFRPIMGPFTRSLERHGFDEHLRARVGADT